MKKESCSCGNIFGDWFYAILVLILGLLLLVMNLGFVDASLVSYWPLLLIIVGLKELLDRH